MSLFGAATMGVDPQTGSYLSKEQRIAMFRASRGQGNSGGGASSSGNSSRVAPQNSIVVSNKFSQITQTLSNNYQQAAQNISEQVAENSRNIKNIYTILEKRTEEEAKFQKEENRDIQKQVEDSRRGIREKFVEGISSAAAALVKPLQNAAKTIGDKSKGLFSKLIEALTAFGALWLVDNLPYLKKKFEQYFKDIGNFKTDVLDSFSNIRGLFTIFDTILKKITGFVSKIAKTAFNAGRNIVKTASKVSKRILTSVKGYVQRIIDDVIPALRRFFSGVVDKVKSLIPNTLKNAPKAAKNFLGRGVDFVKGLGKKFMSAVPKPLTDLIDKGKKGILAAGDKVKVGFGKATETIKGLASNLKPSSDSAKQEWIQKALSPLSKLKALKGIGSKIAGIAQKIGKLPVIGSVIDIAINRGIDGDNWTRAIIRGLLSGGFGAVTGPVGAKIGSGVGAAAGALAGGIGAIPGAAIGGALGYGLGAALGGYIGDSLGKVTYDNLFDEGKPLSPVTGAIDSSMNAIQSSVQSNFERDPASTVDISSKLKGLKSGSSTPDGMGMPSSENILDYSTDIIELPTEYIDQRKPQQQNKEVVEEQDVPFLPTANPFTSMYRKYSMEQFDMTLEGAFG